MTTKTHPETLNPEFMPTRAELIFHDCAVIFATIALIVALHFAR